MSKKTTLGLSALVIYILVYLYIYGRNSDICEKQGMEYSFYAKTCVIPFKAYK